METVVGLTTIAVALLIGLGALGTAIAFGLLGGAGVPYWSAIGEHYGLNLEVVNTALDPLAPARQRGRGRQ